MKTVTAFLLSSYLKPPQVLQLCFSQKSAFFLVSTLSTLAYALVLSKFSHFLTKSFPPSSVPSVQTIAIDIFPFSHHSKNVPLLLKSQHWLISPIKWKPASFFQLWLTPLLLTSDLTFSWKAFSSPVLGMPVYGKQGTLLLISFFNFLHQKDALNLKRMVDEIPSSHLPHLF